MMHFARSAFQYMLITKITGFASLRSCLLTLKCWILRSKSNKISGNPSRKPTGLFNWIYLYKKEHLKFC